MTFAIERQVRWQQRLAELEVIIAKLKAESEKARKRAKPTRPG
jgi:hypothetical protein